MEIQTQTPNINPGDHEAYMRLALALAEKSPPKPTNYRVGAVVVEVATNKILATGYTLELPGNTHAEQCCIQKLAKEYDVEAAQLGQALHSEVAIYTTVEPCCLRLSGNKPCVERILDIGKDRVRTVYVGVQEPDTFVSGNSGSRRLQDAGIEVVHVPGLEKKILEVATAGHNTEQASQPR